MISKLKRKFTILATVSTFLLVVVLVLIMNSVNYTSVVSESDAILDVLSQPDASFFDNKKPPIRPNEKSDFIPHGMSPEIPYESRYFTVIIDSAGNIQESNMSNIISVDETSAEEYINSAFNSKEDRGFIDQFRFSKTSNDNGTKILFLDCGRKLDSFQTFMWISIAVGFLGCFLVFILFLCISGRIVRPIAESYERQKQFISNASHELKTPLTIIGANVDLLEVEGKKDELTDIRYQITRLADLTENLVTLSKIEEPSHDIQKIDFPISDIVSETAHLFCTVLASKNIHLDTNITPNLTLNGSPNSIRQLVSIILDNAAKYSPEGTTVSIDLASRKKTVVLSVTNKTNNSITKEDLKYIFDRFYRTDLSRNSATGGHGIGLSIAKAITDSHNGTIRASIPSEENFTITVVLPQ